MSALLSRCCATLELDAHGKPHGVLSSKTSPASKRHTRHVLRWSAPEEWEAWGSLNLADRYPTSHAQKVAILHLEFGSNMSGLEKTIPFLPAPCSSEVLSLSVLHQTRPAGK